MAYTCVGCGKQIDAFDLYEREGVKYHLECPSFVDPRRILHTFDKPIATAHALNVIRNSSALAMLGVKEGKVVIYLED